MWFGDLVTMRWWNGIWLNEAFATLMELLCVDALPPRVASGGCRSAWSATRPWPPTGLHSTRPVEYPVGPPEEADGMFDVLTYQKGAGVLRMLERYLGAERFRAGVRHYLETHRFGNTETADLWDAIEAASGEPVRDVMDSWILQGGFPLVTVEGAPGPTSATCTTVLRQEPFQYSRAAGASSIGSDLEGPRHRAGPSATATPGSCWDPSPSRLTLASDGPDSVVVVNAGRLGLLPRPLPARAAPPAGEPPARARRAGTLQPARRHLGRRRRPAVRTRGLPPAGRGARGGERPRRLGPGHRRAALLDRTVDDATRPLVAAYTRALLGPVLARLGWEPRPGEGPRTPTLRAQVLGILGTVGQRPRGPGARAPAPRRGAAGGASTLDPDLASAILTPSAASGGRHGFEIFLELYRHPATPQDEIALPLRPDRLPRRRPSPPGPSSWPGPRCAPRTPPSSSSCCWPSRDHGPATWPPGPGALGRARGPHPGQHPAPHARRGPTCCAATPSWPTTSVASFVQANPLPVGQRTVDQTLERLEVNEAFATSLRETAGPVLRAGLQRQEKR